MSHVDIAISMQALSQGPSVPLLGRFFFQKIVMCFCFSDNGVFYN